MEHTDNGLFIKQERFEVLAILRDIYKQRTPLRVANQQQQCFHSQILSVGADSIVFDCTNDSACAPGEYRVIIESQDAKIEFLLDQAEITQHQHIQAISSRLPKELVYIQRRRQFRITTPYWRQFLCSGNYPDGSPFQLRIHDLSVGGVGLRLDGPVPPCLESGVVFSKVQLDLGDYGKFKVNLELIAAGDERVECEETGDVKHFTRLSCRFVSTSVLTARKIHSAVIAFELDFNKKKKR
ncbi:flagellar brake protein [Serratia sp. AKBS12]|uniref:flagellar brake protein n=1 Tax=Serratia sp. AKBS12 TaxID=2974597 RepID=UPI002166188B|nr:flagellar brake protein [Serratia sp. AKBS12]MCS3408620.1 flagellar brake protein [Serratia sp. AKBS12]HEI8864957.1 flagellar brake protein [Serratia odorifera]